MIKKFPKYALSALTVVILGSGCTPLGPNFEGLGKPTIPAKWQQDNKKDLYKVAKWWKIFGDPTLNKLIKKAYGQNLDIKSAGLRIVQARMALGVSEGYTYPQLQRLSGNAASIKSGKNEFASAAINFDIGWELDFWGKYARNIESAQANLYQSIASYNDIMVSIIAEVARNYINYRTAQERLAYATRNITIQERVTQMTEVQFNAGNVSELDMQQARSQLYNTRAILPAIEVNKVKAKNALAVLLGIDEAKVRHLLAIGSKKHADSINRYIGKKKRNTIQIKQSSHDLLNVAMVPVANFNPHYKIDANLITRRPDIKVAEYQVRSNNALIGATIAELYPSFSLFGNIGLSPNSSTGSWVSGTNALGVSVGPSFSWNIWQYGRIKNQIRIRDAVFEESIVNYNKKILTAIQEISDALSSYELGLKQQEENRKAVEATVRAFNISAIQYNDGLVNYERLLTTVESLTRTQDQYAQIKGSLSNYVVLLYKALGGGWQTRRGSSYLSDETAQKMQKRIDWGRYLNKKMTTLPKDMQ